MSAEKEGRIGEALRKRRMLRGESHETVHQHTRIPKRFLAAMEEDRIGELPGPVYFRGFLKTYCDHLDIPFEPLWRSYQGAPDAEAAPDEPQGPQEGELRRAPAPKRGPKMVLPLSESTLIPALLFAGLLCAAGLLWVLKGPGAEPVRYGGEAAAAQPGAPVLRLAAVSDCWIHLRDGDKLLFEGNVPAGTAQEWRGKGGFVLKAAPSGALRVELDSAALALGELPRNADGAYLIAR